MLLSERIKADGITCTSKARTAVPEGELFPDLDTRWFDVTLHLDGREFCLSYGLGPAAGEQPETEEVIALVIMGVRSVYCNTSFRAWADDWGFPQDEQRAAMYEQWRQHLARLRVFLGSGRFLAYMNETQDDI